MKFIVTVLLAWAGTTAWANPNLEQKINLVLSNAPATEFIQEISVQTNLNFIVDQKIKFKKISLQIKDMSLKSVMDTFALQQNVTWSIADNEYIKISVKK